MQFQLRQRGRASMDFAADLGGTLGRLGQTVGGKIAEMDLDADLDRRMEQVEGALQGFSPRWFACGIGNWLSRQHGRIAGDAFAEIEEELAPTFEALRRGGSTLEVRDGFRPPDYWVGVDFHCTAGGWTREHQGFIHGELIHPLYVARNFPGQIFRQRAEVLKALGPRRYRKILEMGASSGHYTLQLAQAYPEAALTGVDLSMQMLEQAQRLGNEHDFAWRLIQAAAEDTGLPAAQYDLVTSYILLHELPARAVKAVFAEAFRLLEPGGTLFMADVRPFHDQSRLEEWRALDLAQRGGEPYWRESASLDLALVAGEVGFADVRSYGLGEGRYPWVTWATKPGRS